MDIAEHALADKDSIDYPALALSGQETARLVIEQGKGFLVEPLYVMTFWLSTHPAYTALCLSLAHVIHENVPRDSHLDQRLEKLKNRLHENSGHAQEDLNMIECKAPAVPRERSAKDFAYQHSRDSRTNAAGRHAFIL